MPWTKLDKSKISKINIRVIDQRAADGTMDQWMDRPTHGHTSIDSNLITLIDLILIDLPYGR